MEIDSFLAMVVDINGSLRVTIPFKLAQFNGIKKGDRVKVWIKKVPETGLK